MNKLFLIFGIAFIFIFLSSFTSAAIAFDSASQGKVTGNTALTYSHTVTGSNTLLVVGVSIESASDLVTGVTYNGVGMTRIQYQTGNAEGAYLYYVNASAGTGTHNIVVSTSSSTDIRSASVSYTGVLQSGQPDASTKQTTTVNNPVTTALNTVADSSWMISYAQSNGFVVSAGAGTTFRSQTVDQFNGIGDSNSPITPPQSYSMSWSGGTVWNIVQASFSPVITQNLNITLVSPQSGSVIGINPVNSINFTSFYNLSTAAYNLSNATTYVWFSNGTLFNQTTVNIQNSTNNLTRVLINNFQVNSYLWNVNVCYRNSTFVNCTFSPANYSFQTSNYTLNNVSYNNFTYETKSENFLINITSPTIPTNAQFVYNSTTYPATVINNSGGNFTINSTIDVPIGQGANNFYFNFNLGSNMATTQTYIQNVTNTTLFLCSGGYTPYINFTGYDEMTLLQLPYSIASSTFTYWLGSGTVIKQLFYSNTTSVPYYTFCLTPQNVSLNTNYSYSYQATNYPIRTIINSSLILTNSTTLQNLYLMPQSSGIAVTFQVVNPATQALSGVYATATRNINGVNVIVGSGYTGLDGGVTFFVNPLLTYSFTFSKAGYNTFTLVTTPAQSSYTITLGANQQNVNDYTKGISYVILPTFGTMLNGSAIINFNYTINSSFWTLQQFGYTLYGSNGSMLITNFSVNPIGGTVSSLFNVSNLSYVTMNYFYLINGTFITGNITWATDNLVGTQYSIYNSFLDLGHYLTSGNFYGLTPFGLGIIMFAIIFITTGTISWKFGYTSPMAIVGIIFAQVLLYDVGLGLIPNPVGAVPHFPTVAIGLIIVGMIIRERTG